MPSKQRLVSMLSRLSAVHSQPQQNTEYRIGFKNFLSHAKGDTSHQATIVETRIWTSEETIAMAAVVSPRDRPTGGESIQKKYWTFVAKSVCKLRLSKCLMYLRSFRPLHSLLFVRVVHEAIPPSLGFRSASFSFCWATSVCNPLSCYFLNR